MTQLELENGLGLGSGQPKALHQHRLGLIFGADDGNDLINIEKGDQQAVENVQPVDHLVEPELQAPDDGLASKCQPFRQQVFQVFEDRPTIQADDVEIEAGGFLQIGGREQMIHEGINVNRV